MLCAFITLTSPSQYLLLRTTVTWLLLVRSFRELVPTFSILTQDLISLSLLTLRIWITVLIINVQFSSTLKGYLRKVWILLLIRLSLVFFCSDILLLYFFFEISLIPIFIVVIGWGYQPERLAAGIFLFFYTLFASIPLLLFIFKVSTDSGSHYSLLSGVGPLEVKGLLFFIGVIAFMVKFPVFGLHMWLPKAHVEAPVSGSMVLAGVLLKLGGYGLLRIEKYFSSSMRFLFLRSFILIGGGLLRVFCLGASDLKILIAYSSVVHMALIVIGFKWFRSLGISGGIIIILAHGICSSGLFAMANRFYERSHSRSFNLNKGLLARAPFIVGMAFFLIRANFGGPFTLNLLGEILLILSLGQINQGLLVSILLLSFFSAAYRLILFRRVIQGRMSSSREGSHEYSSRELRFCLAHCWPLFTLCLRPRFNYNKKFIYF